MSEIEVKQITKGINNLVERIWGNDIIDIFINKIKLTAALSSYADKYISRFGSIKVLGMNKPLPVLSIYTGVNVIDHNTRDQFRNINKLEKIYVNEGFQGLSQNGNSEDAIKIANEVRLLNVLGAPGAGKSTLLKRIGIEALTVRKKTAYYHNLLPVLIELKLIRTSSPDFCNIVLDNLNDYNFPNDKATLKKLLKKGAFIFLFDGLDEVDAKYVQVICNALIKFHTKYDKNRYITTCRTAFYSNNFNNFTDVALLDFNAKQINRFALNWFTTKGIVNEYDNFMQEITSDQNRSSYDLARTPLLLTFLCIVYSKTLSFPANRASLYKKALETLLHDWLVEKQVSVFDAFDGLHVDLEILMLACLAGPMYERNKLFFLESEISSVFRSYLKQELNAPKNIDSKKLIKIIEQKQGVLVERSHGVYSFSHLTIHEYLAAYWFKETDNIHDLVEKHAFDFRWREVFLLLSGMGNAGKLIKKLYIKSNKLFLLSYNFKKLCIWIKDYQKYEKSLTNIIIRSRLLFWYISKLHRNNYHIDIKLQTQSIKCISRTISAFEDLYAEEYDSNKDFDAKYGIKINELNKSLKIDRWTDSDFENVTDYFSLFKLIIDCKKASLSLGRKQWDNALNSFLNVPLM